MSSCCEILSDISNNVNYYLDIFITTEQRLTSLYWGYS